MTRIGNRQSQQMSDGRQGDRNGEHTENDGDK
jgi:hypothetical protein